MPFPDAEARIRRLVGRIGGVESDVRTLRSRLGKVNQDLAGLGGASSHTPCVTTFRGRLDDCLLTGLANSTIRVVGHQTGIDYGTFVADDPESVGAGSYLAEVKISPDDTDVDLYISGPSGAGGRFAASSLASTYGFSRCTANVFNSSLVVASGYTCALDASGDPGPCDLPLATTLNCTDSAYGGPFSCTYNASTLIWTGCQSVAYPGRAAGPTCAAVTTAYRYHLIRLSDRFRLTFDYPQILPGSCPATGTCASSMTGNTGGGDRFSWTCPDPSTSTKFSVTFTITGPSILYPTGATITFAEP